MPVSRLFERNYSPWLSASNNFLLAFLLFSVARVLFGHVFCAMAESAAVSSLNCQQGDYCWDIEWATSRLRAISVHTCSQRCSRVLLSARVPKLHEHEHASKPIEHVSKPIEHASINRVHEKQDHSLAI